MLFAPIFWANETLYLKKIYSTALGLQRCSVFTVWQATKLWIHMNEIWNSQTWNLKIISCEPHIS